MELCQCLHLISSKETCKGLHADAAPPACPSCGSTSGFIVRRHFTYTEAELFEDAWLQCETCGKKTTLEELA